MQMVEKCLFLLHQSVSRHNLFKVVCEWLCFFAQLICRNSTPKTAFLLRSSVKMAYAGVRMFHDCLLILKLSFCLCQQEQVMRFVVMFLLCFVPAGIGNGPSIKNASIYASIIILKAQLLVSRAEEGAWYCEEGYGGTPQVGRIRVLGGGSVLVSLRCYV